MSLKAVCVGRYNEGQALACRVVEKDNGLMKKDIEKIGSKVKALRSRQGQRDKLKTVYGIWFVTHYKNIYYAVCTDQTYPERHAFGMIEKLKAEIDGKQDEPQLEKLLKKKVEELSQTYSDIRKVDKVRKAQDEVGMLEGELNIGIKKLMGNKETITQLDDKADEMKFFAREFEKKAVTLEKQMCWQKWKLYLIVGGAVLGVVAIILIVVLVTKNI